MSKKYVDSVNEYMDASIATITELKKQAPTIATVIKALKKTKNASGIIYIMGNGGSSSTASHMAQDLNKTTIKGPIKKRFKAFSLTDNTPIVMAWANDSNFDIIFEEQLKNFLKKEDLVIGISGSGNSTNVLRAIEYAKKEGVYTIGITGMGGGKLAKAVDVSVVVPDSSMQRCEDMHLMLNHMIIDVFLKHGEEE